MTTIRGFELHFVARRHDNGTTKNRRLLPVRGHDGIPLFYEQIEDVNKQIEDMSRLIVDTVFYAVPKRRKMEAPPANVK